MVPVLLAKMSTSDIVWIAIAVLFGLAFVIAIVINLVEYTKSASGSIRRIVVGIIGMVFLLSGYFVPSGWLSLIGIICLFLVFVDAVISTFRKQIPTKESKEQIEGMKFR